MVLFLYPKLLFVMSVQKSWIEHSRALVNSKEGRRKKGTNPSAESDFLSSSLRAFRTRTSLAFLATGSSYGLNLLFGAAHTAHTQPQNKDVQLSRKAN
jgi:hypothetical protein